MPYPQSIPQILFCVTRPIYLSAAKIIRLISFNPTFIFNILVSLLLDPLHYISSTNDVLQKFKDRPVLGRNLIKSRYQLKMATLIILFIKYIEIQDYILYIRLPKSDCPHIECLYKLFMFTYLEYMFVEYVYLK